MFPEYVLDEDGAPVCVSVLVMECGCLKGTWRPAFSKTGTKISLAIGGDFNYNSVPQEGTDPDAHGCCPQHMP